MVIGDARAILTSDQTNSAEAARAPTISAPVTAPDHVAPAVASEDATQSDDDEKFSVATQAFISWAHAHPDWETEEVEEWERKVATFTATLRSSGGIDADVDLYHAADPDIDWTRYGPNRIDEYEFVLIVISEAWADRWSGRNEPTVGAGAVGEADALHGLFTRHQTAWQRRVKIIVFPDVSDAVIPNDLARVSRFYVDPDDLDTYDSLLRSLTAQPRHVPPPLSSVPALGAADLRRAAIRTKAARTRRAEVDEESLQERLETVIRGIAAAETAEDYDLLTRLVSQRTALQTTLDALFES